MFVQRIKFQNAKLIVNINAWEAVVVPKAAKVCFREFFLDLNVNAVTRLS